MLSVIIMAGAIQLTDGEPGSSLLCASHAQSGEVEAMSPLNNREDSPIARRPYTRRGGQNLPVASGAPLCKDDLLVNPAGSNDMVTATLRGGRHVPVPPGSSFSVPAPSPWAAAAELIARFDDSFQRPDVESDSGTRGPGGWRSVFPLPAQIDAVPAWGPLRLVWAEGVGGRVTVDAAGVSTTLDSVSGAAIDLGRLCPVACTLSISTSDGAIDATAAVHVISEESAPHPSWLERLNHRAEDFAVEGAWLVKAQNDPRWRLQGASLIAYAACAYPGARPAVRALYRVRRLPELCVGQ